jgi:hypothetical protein
MSKRRTKYREPLKFLREAIKSPGEDCIEWPFQRDKLGYGRVRFAGKNSNAHRVALILHTGVQPPPDVEVAHAVECHNPSCFNPLHLRFATRKENNDDRYLNGTMTAGEASNLAKLTEAQVIAIRKDPRLISEIAADYAVTRGNIWSIKSRITWEHLPGEIVPSPDGQPKGSVHTEAKITEADVIAIRADTRTQKVIASDYGISQTQVSRIKRREKWAHVTHKTAT